MKPSKTHYYQLPCEIKKDVFRKLKIIDSGDYVEISTDNSGDCRNMLWEVLEKFINSVSREKAIEILSGSWDKTNSNFKGYICECGIAGNKSCVDRLAKYLKEGK